MPHAMTNQAPLTQTIESLLLYKGGALKHTEIAKVTGESVASVVQALDELEQILECRGVQLVRDTDRVALTTATASYEFIEKMRREELEGPIGKAGLETLAVIVYQGPATRAAIEYIRGVNVSTTLRSLMIRGLIERVENPNDKRSFLYRATPELSAYFGVTRLTDLPDYEALSTELGAVLTTQPAETETT